MLVNSLILWASEGYSYCGGCYLVSSSQSQTQCFITYYDILNKFHQFLHIQTTKKCQTSSYQFSLAVMKVGNTVYNTRLPLYVQVKLYMCIQFSQCFKNMLILKVFKME